MIPVHVVVSSMSEEFEIPSKYFHNVYFLHHDCRYRLPLRCATHDSTSSHRVAPLPQYDPLAHGALAEMLRLTWNLAWNGSLDDLIKACRSQPQPKDAKQL